MSEHTHPWCLRCQDAEAEIASLRAEKVALLTRLEAAEQVAEAAQAVLDFWGGGEMEHEYPRSQLKELRATLTAWQEARDEA